MSIEYISSLGQSPKIQKNSFKLEDLSKKSIENKLKTLISVNSEDRNFRLCNLERVFDLFSSLEFKLKKFLEKTLHKSQEDIQFILDRRM